VHASSHAAPAAATSRYRKCPDFGLVDIGRGQRYECGARFTIVNFKRGAWEQALANAHYCLYLECGIDRLRRLDAAALAEGLAHEPRPFRRAPLLSICNNICCK
jgi:hypothetical protein